MRVGERNIYIIIAVLVVGVAAYKGIQELRNPDRGIPFYTTASTELQLEGEAIYQNNGCSDCHKLWMVRNWMENVPAPDLDGIGSLRSEQWLYDYLSSENPQSIIPSRLKKQYRMPSYAHLPEGQRRNLAAYLASLKVEDWYFEEVKQAEYEALTGEPYLSDNEQSSN